MPCVMTSSDVITWAPVKRAGVITNFPSSKDAPEIPACLSVGLALHSLVSKVLLPDSHSFFLLLFFIHQIAFHFPPLLGPPLSVTPNPPFSFSLSLHLSASVSLPNVPLSFPPCFFPPLSSPLATSCCNFRTKRGGRRRRGRERFFDLVNCASSFVFMPRQSFLQGCVRLCGLHSSSPLLLYLGGGYRDKQWLHHCTVCTSG